MTLEEIYKRMKQNNPYYEGSQAQKEEQAGMTVKGDTVNHTENSAQIHQDYIDNQPTFNTFISGAPTYKEQLKDNFIQIKRRTKNFGKNFISGVGNGIRGIIDVPFQETENNLKKGENSNKNLWQHILKSAAYTLNPNVSFIDNIISSNKNATNILKDKNKSGYEKVANIVTDGVTNVVDASTTGKKGLDASIELLGKLSQNNSEKISDKVQNVQNKVDEPFKKYDEKVQKDNNNFGNVEKFLFNVSNSLGNMAPSIVASAVTKNPNIGLATMGYSVKGQSTEEAREKGQELQKAIDIGNTKGAIEVGTELLTGGINFFGKGALDDIAKRGIDSKVKNQVLNFIAKKGYDFAGEIGEETVSDILNTMLDKGTTDPDINYSIKDWSDTALSTLLSTAVLNTIGGGYTKKAYNQNAQELKNNTGIITKDIDNTEMSQLSRNTTNDSINSIVSQKQIAPINLEQQINNALVNNQSSNKSYLGKVKEKISQRIKQLTNIDVYNRKHVLTDNDIRHMLKEHGNPEIEAKKGQIAITKQDINKIPEIIENPDNIIKGSDNKLGQTIRYIKKYNNNSTYVVEVVPEKSKSLIIKTMWKKPSTLTNDQVLSSTSGTKGSDVSSTINNIISQNENYASSNQNMLKNNGEEVNIDNKRTSTIDFIVDKRTKEKTSINEVKDFLAQKIVNKGHTVDKLAKATKNSNLKYAYDRTLSSFSEANYSIGKGQTNNKGKIIGKSLNEIFKPIEDIKLSKEFEDYLLNRHNLDRLAVEKAVYDESITSETSRKIIKDYEEKYPQFKEVAKEVYNFNKNELNNLVEAGFIDKNSMNYLNELYGDYVPIHRDIIETVQKVEESKNISNNPIKRAIGGANTILSVKEAMAEQVVKNKKAIRMNELGLEVAKSLGEKAVIDPDIEITYSPSAIMSLGGDVITFNGKQPIFTVFKNGVAKDIKIGDDLYDSLKKDTLINRIQNNKKLNKILAPIEKISNIQRNLLTTYSIGFALSNPIKDFQDGMFNTKYSPTRYIKNYNKALIEICFNGKNYETYLANGGNSNTYFDYQKGLLPQKTKNPIKIFTDMIKNINEILEQAPRLAEYISTIEKGGSVNEAMYNAADITTNFKRGGEYAKVLNKYGANFLNASIQGLNKQYRNLTGQRGWKGYVNLLLKTTTLGIGTAILNHLLLKDDEEYQNLLSYVKDNYYLFKMDNGKFFRIPKGRVLSIIGSTARRIFEGIEGKDIDLKGLVSTVKTQLAPNNPFESNIFSPIKSVKDNKTWYGDDIVSSRLQKELPKNQYDETTDSISKWLGNITNISPKKISYLIEQYSGGIGDVILPRLTPQAENNILEDKFITDAVMKNKNVSKFYNSLEEFQQKSNDSKSTENDKIKYKYLSSISSDMSELYKRKREIQNSNMEDKDKKEIGRDIQKQINDLAEKGVDALKKDMTIDNKWDMYINSILSDKVRENDNSSDVMDAQYAIENKICTKKDYMALYEKCRKNKVEMPTMKILEKMNNTGIDLNNYIDYKIGTKEIKGEKDNKGKTIKSSASTKEAKYILSMNISDKQKDILLNFLSDTETPPTVSDLKKLNGEYLTYMQQSGKKDDKGVSARDKYMMYIDAGIPVTTLNKYYDEIGDIEGVKDSKGKTISGSKKKALFNYINSLSLNATQKKILFTKCNSSYGKNYKSEIHAYINSLNISKKRKEQIWSELYD